MRLGFPLPPGLIPFSLRFLDLLEKWNQVHSLTALPPGEREEELVLDATVLLPWLDRLEPGSTVVDFGTGMGVPALLVAAWRPDLRVVAIDKSRKKIAFVRQAGAELDLGNLKALSARIEDLPPLQAALGTAKAVGTMPLLLGWWSRHGLPGAPFLALKGPNWTEEPAVAGWSLQAHPYTLPRRGRRVLVEARAAGG